ncbi:TetR/AcrR family transcriptional regulator [Massilia sp. TS11]|uniref:TetR/AcrR family transcriptional regulator n=1 Tax=Massilia sp. TS11 TaxID=2908003 RepID=UPI001EDA035C|nr:TetR/AcrR family transcriptional regulator [Massilia sp. TS11]MCG2584476.1 TetR/AcrR family transcriptional regulator [Massilia sp. TS11]
MKVSKEQAKENRERVIDTAARLFRERGYNGVGVADLMQNAGLTHGAFYGQFKSKDDLLAEACQHAIEGATRTWAKVGAAHPEDPLAAIAGAYLSPLHRDHPGQGCALAALGPELARQSLTVRDAVTTAMKKQVGRLAPLMHGETEAEREQGALVTIASMVGALLLSRIVTDPALSEGFLDAVHDAITGHETSD